MPRPKKIPHKRRADGTYEAKVTIGKTFDGKPIRKSFYSSKSFEDAKAQGERYKIEREIAEKRGEILPADRVSFEDVARTVLNQKKNKVKEITYTLSWKNTIEKYLIPYFKNTDISRIRKNDVENYFNQHADMARSSLCKHLVCLNAIFNNAVDNRYITSSPIQNFKLETGGKSKDKSCYTSEQAELILEYCKKHRFGLDIHLLLKYGMSRSELLGIMWEDIDFTNLTIRIKQGVTLSQSGDGIVISETKNKFRSRTIAIDQETADMIMSTTQHEYLITTVDGNVCRPDTWFKRHYLIFMRDMHDYYLKQDPPVDIPILNPHELRHTRASIWVNEGRNLFAIADQMGWSDLEMLRKTYGHGDINELRKELGL